jgi:hypothetical protein
MLASASGIAFGEAKMTPALTHRTAFSKTETAKFAKESRVKSQWKSAVIPVLAEADSQGGFPNRAEFDSTMANKRRFAMAAAVGLRGDYDAGALRAAAKRSKDGAQTRRLLALCGDLRRREPYRGGEDWRGDASGRSRLGGKVQRAGA